jgi:hypothetical protein
MSVSIVTGVGPRTGTSFVMCRARDAGMPVSGDRFPASTVPKHNPDGYWETDPRDIHALDNTVAKLWGQSIASVGNARISRLLVLERENKDEQIESMRRVLKDELMLAENAEYAGIAVDSSDILSEFVRNMDKWLSGIEHQKILRVQTRDLSSRIGEVLRFLKGGL